MNPIVLFVLVAISMFAFLFATLRVVEAVESEAVESGLTDEAGWDNGNRRAVAVVMLLNFWTVAVVAVVAVAAHNMGV